ncbi:hypothetical protein [Moraxella lacunata]
MYKFQPINRHRPSLQYFYIKLQSYPQAYPQLLGINFWQILAIKNDK